MLVIHPLVYISNRNSLILVDDVTLDEMNAEYGDTDFLSEPHFKILLLNKIPQAIPTLLSILKKRGGIVFVATCSCK